MAAVDAGLCRPARSEAKSGADASTRRVGGCWQAMPVNWALPRLGSRSSQPVWRLRRGAVEPFGSVGRREMRLAHLHQAGPAILAIDQAENRPHDRTPLFDQHRSGWQASVSGSLRRPPKWFLGSPKMVSSGMPRDQAGVGGSKRPGHGDNGRAGGQPNSNRRQEAPIG